MCCKLQGHLTRDSDHIPKRRRSVMREFGERGRCNGGPAAPPAMQQHPQQLQQQEQQQQQQQQTQQEMQQNVVVGPRDTTEVETEEPGETTPLTLVTGDPPDKDLTDINSLLNDIHRLEGREEGIPLTTLAPATQSEGGGTLHPPSTEGDVPPRPRSSRSRKASTTSDDVIEIEPNKAAQLERVIPDVSHVPDSTITTARRKQQRKKEKGDERKILNRSYHKRRRENTNSAT
ncbi:uncharacterized protein LOC143026799 [Oratosquilla oratoria]|uniref:uncharacterized protein LOC143026799 n=1 Tax=Oratosquilla oratoria TaxID=337810 RepID=UPI003F758DAF